MNSTTPPAQRPHPTPAHLLAALALLIALLLPAAARADTEQTVCGAVGEYQPPTRVADGSITVADEVFPIVSGSELIGAELIREGAALCLNTVPDRTGRLVAYSVTESAEQTQSVDTCGFVKRYVPATGTKPGALRIDLDSWPLAPGTALAGDQLLGSGAPVCLNAVIGQGGIVNGIVAEAPTPVSGPEPTALPTDQRAPDVDPAPIGGMPSGLPATGGGVFSSPLPSAMPTALPAYYAGLAALAGAVVLRRRR